MQLQFHNTLSGSKEQFTPIDAHNVRIYVCGPTVYARPHIGNARSVVVYDVMFRLLRHIYGDEAVRYARNITDVDDKINAAAIEGNITIQALTERVTGWFHEDMDALHCLRPTIEPRATEHIGNIIALIETLVANGNAYAADGHVLFDITSAFPEAWDYGSLSRRTMDQMVAGARVEVAPYKKHPGDFVLWKPAKEEDDASSKFESPWGVGRPGWHIECSAMSKACLGETFDIHGGGADLKFPHHENEIAQSRCAHPESEYAKYWVHNGFLTVDGEKMSKSLGNFTTVHELLEQGINGEVIRLALLSSKYNEPLDWNAKVIEDTKKTLDKCYRVIEAYPNQSHEVPNQVLEALSDDLNTPQALSVLVSELAQEFPFHVKAAGEMLGILQDDPTHWFKGVGDDSAEIEAQIQARADAKKAKDFAEADRIRDALKAQGIVLEDRPDGSTDWRRG